MSTPFALPEAVLTRFRTVAFERLERIDATWVALTQGVAAPKAEEEMFREVHTLKGDARVVGFADVAVLCQRLEDLLSAARHRHYRVHEDVDVVVTMAIQFVGMLLRKKGALARGGIDLDGFLAQIEQVLSDWLRRSSEAPGPTTTARPRLHGDAPAQLSPTARDRLSVVATTVYLEHLRAPERSRKRLRDVWDVLSREIGELEATLVRPLLAGHGATAGEIARELGKEVAVVVEAGEVHASEEVLDALNTAVLHAIRNAIDHGIEAPEQRLRAGKAAEGTVHVRVRQRDDCIELDVSDDGSGIDFDAVRRKAERAGLAPASELATATEEQLAEMLFSPGFSTRDTVTDVSGRGVGLDAARAAVTRLGGQTRIESKPGQGVTVSVVIPNRRPSADVHAFRAPGSDVSFAVSAQWVAEDGPWPDVTVRDPLELLEIPRDPRATGASVLRLRLGARRFALATDGSVARASALRLCPTPDDVPFEIVKLAEYEAVLIRPERWPETTGTVPRA